MTTKRNERRYRQHKQARQKGFIVNARKREVCVFIGTDVNKYKSLRILGGEFGYNIQISVCL